MVFAGHQGRDKTLALARKKYYWPTLQIDMEAHVAQCIKCDKHKGVIKGAAPILQYPVPELPWDVVSIDLLQLPQSHYDIWCWHHYTTNLQKISLMR